MKTKLKLELEYTTSTESKVRRMCDMKITLIMNQVLKKWFVTKPVVRIEYSTRVIHSFHISGDIIITLKSDDTEIL